MDSWPVSNKIVLALLVAMLVFAASGVRFHNPLQPVFGSIARTECQN